MVNLYEVTPALYIRGEIKGLTLASKEKAFKDQGINAVVCTLQKADTELAESGIVEYLHRPLPDSKIIDEDYVEGIVAEVVRRIRAGRKVLVHCIAGRNRSGLISALAYRQLTRSTGKEALEHVRSVKDKALSNPAFEQYLLSLGRYEELEGEPVVKTLVEPMAESIGEIEAESETLVTPSPQEIQEFTDWLNSPVSELETVVKEPVATIEAPGLIKHKSGVWIRPGGTDATIVGEMSLYKTMDLRKGDVILDVGAHIGAFAVWALERGAGHVVCYEPEPNNLEVLRANAEGKSIDIRAAALVADNSPTIDLWLSHTRDQSLHSTIQHRGRVAVKVDAHNFWDVVDEIQPQIIKIDIEGGEYDILRAGREIPGYVRSIGIEFHFSRKVYAEWAAAIFAKFNSQYIVGRAPRVKAWATMGVWNRP